MFATNPNFRPSPAIAYTRALGAEIVEDFALGTALQEQVGGWILQLGSASSKLGGDGFETAFQCGREVVRQLRLPFATGHSTGTMEAGNLGAVTAFLDVTTAEQAIAAFRGEETKRRALEFDCRSVGIYLSGLPTEQYQNPYCTDSIVCKSLLGRQHLLLAGALGIIIALEGGWGTVLEIGHQLIEMRRQKFAPTCPLVFIDRTGQWERFCKWMREDMVERKLWGIHEYRRLKVVNCTSAAIDYLRPLVLAA